MDKYYEMYGEMYCKQLELELAYKTEAEEMLKAVLDKAVANGEAATTKLGGKLIDYAYDTTASNMRALVESVKKPKRGVVPAYTALIKDLLKIYDDERLDALLAVAALSNTLSSVFLNKNTISEIALSIADDIEREAQVEAFFAYKAVKDGTDGIDWKLVHNFDEALKKRVQRSYKISYATNRMHKEDFVWSNWGKKDKLAFGAKLLEMTVKGSGYFDESLNKDNIAVIMPKEWLLKTWTKNMETMQRYAHKFCPTIIPPKPWVDTYTGGYYGELSRFVSLLRLHPGQTSSFTSEYKKKLNQVDLAYIYKALNAMQDTAFCINKRILEVSEQILASGGGLGFPRTEPFPQLPRLEGEHTEKELKEHKRKMVGIIKQNQARASKALRAVMSVSTARKFAEYSKIYFPWNVDYRGRCYPIPSALSPQGDDITKALLLFAEPEACQDPSAYKWLAIHGANLAGHDKITFEERIAWVEQHTSQILSSAKDPLGYTWWYEESKGDYPLEFLAFCFEWERLQEWLETHKDCVGFRSGLVIAFDGTCSGLQHFSALLRDEVGGKAVNLMPMDTVQDVYALVADKVNKVLLRDAKSGTDDSYKKDKQGKYVLNKDDEKIIQFGTKTLAQQWLIFARDKYNQEGITRKVVKRSVMTLAYGSKKYGFKDNIQSDIIEPYILDHPETHPFTSKEQAAMYMAGLTWNAVSDTVVKAVEGMAYLQKLAALICKNSKVVTWMTPNGLPVQQNYFKREQKVFEMRFNGVKKRFYIEDTDFNIDPIAQRNAVSPNYIHSMDASHLQRVVVASFDKGNRNFAMIHDSFGTDMSRAGELFVTIREEFVSLYDNVDRLQEFTDDVMYLVDEGAKLPDKPEFGILKIKDIENSKFCFA